MCRRDGGGGLLAECPTEFASHRTVSGAQAKATACPNVAKHTHMHMRVARAGLTAVPQRAFGKGHQGSITTAMANRTPALDTVQQRGWKAQWDSSPRASPSQCRPACLGAQHRL